MFDPNRNRSKVAYLKRIHSFYHRRKQMCASVMVISADIKFRDTLEEDQVASFENEILSVTEDEVFVPLYQWYNADFFMNDIEAFYDNCKELKAKPKGNIFMVKRETDADDAETTQVCIKLGVKSYETDDECTFKVMVKKNETKKRKTFTEEEKIQLFKEYWELKKEVPKPKDVYKDFRIGTFYNTCKKNTELMAALKEIQKK